MTENTAIILDECDILTTYRGETFVKGAGYIKTYFVPLDEHFNLIRKQQSLDFYRIEDRQRYYELRNNNVFGSSMEEVGAITNDNELVYSSYDVRNLAFVDDSENEEYNNEDYDSDNSRTISPNDEITDEISYMSSENEVKETRC